MVIWFQAKSSIQLKGGWKMRYTKATFIKKYIEICQIDLFPNVGKCWTSVNDIECVRGSFVEGGNGNANQFGLYDSYNIHTFISIYFLSGE